MAGESGSMPGRRMLPHSGGGDLDRALAAARVIVPDAVAGADGSGQRRTSALTAQVHTAPASSPLAPLATQDAGHRSAAEAAKQHKGVEGFTTDRFADGSMAGAEGSTWPAGVGGPLEWHGSTELAADVVA